MKWPEKKWMSVDVIGHIFDAIRSLEMAKYKLEDEQLTAKVLEADRLLDEVRSALAQQFHEEFGAP